MSRLYPNPITNYRPHLRRLRPRLQSTCILSVAPKGPDASILGGRVLVVGGAMLYLLLAGGQGPSRTFGRDELERLGRAPELSPGEASLVIAAKLAGARPGEPISPTLGGELSSVCDKVVWGNEADWQSLGRFLDTVKERLNPAVISPAGLNSATALVCAAWDVHLKRPQYVNWLSKLAAPESKDDFMVGAPGYNAETRVSNTWPWRVVAKKYKLGPIATSEISGNAAPYTMRDFVSWWEEGRRSGGEGPSFILGHFKT